MGDHIGGFSGGEHVDDGCMERCAEARGGCRHTDLFCSRVLLAMRAGNADIIETTLSQARLVLGAPITAKCQATPELMILLWLMTNV